MRDNTWRPPFRWWSRRVAAVADLFAYFGLLFLLAASTHVSTAEPWRSFHLTMVQWGLMGAAVGWGCWLALGDGSLVIRALTTAVGLVWTWIVWQASGYLAVFDGQIVYWQYFVHCSILYFLTATALAGAARVLFGVRLASPEGRLIPSNVPRQITLRQVVTAVTLCAITFGAARAIAPAWPWHMVESHVAFIVSTACWLLVVMPTAILVVCRLRWLPVTVLYFGLATVLAAAVERSLFKQRVVSISELSFWIQVMFRHMCVLLPHIVATLLVLRLAGIQLHCSRSRAQGNVAQKRQ